MKITMLDGHPVPFSLTVQMDGRSVEADSHLAQVDAFLLAKGMIRTRIDGPYVHYIPNPSMTTNPRLAQVMAAHGLPAPAIINTRVPRPPMFDGVPECLVPALMNLTINRNRCAENEIEEIDAAFLRLLSPWIRKARP